MNKERLVSIIVPVYNSEKFLNRCIDSILAQTYQNFELILVDDGSTDSSLKMCNIYSKNDKRIKVITISNSGPSVARNIGLSKAKGELIQFIDSDDYIDQHMINSMVQAIGYEFELAMCGYYTIYRDKKEINTLESGNFHQNYIVDNFGYLYKNMFVQYLWNKIYLAEIIRKNNLKFDTSTKRGEDLLFNIEYFRKCNSVSIIYEPLYNYICYNENSLTKKYNNTLFEDQQNVFKSIREFLKSYNAYQPNEKIIEKVYMDRIISCFANLFAIDMPFTTEYVKKEIYRIINDETVRDKLKFYDKVGAKWKVLKAMMQIKNVNAIYYMFKLSRYF